MIKRIIIVFILIIIFHTNYSHCLTDYLSNDQSSLQHFLKKLQKVRSIKIKDEGENEIVRIMFIGTSSNGYDRITSQMRKVLQKKFGDGGRGFIALKKGWKYHKYQDIKWAYKNWISRNITSNNRKDGRYGLSGAFFYNDLPAYTKFKTINPNSIEKIEKDEFIPGTRFSNFSILYQSFPKGGDFWIKLDKEKKIKISTDNNTIEDKVFSLSTKDESHKISIQTGSSEVRLYGVIFERDHGIVVDAMMLVGAKASIFYNFNQEHIQNQLNFRNPDLLIFQMGANDLKHNKSEKDLENFINDYVHGINMIKKGVPNASCLVITDKDIGVKHNGKIITHPNFKKTVEAISQVSKKTNCAFFDLFHAMGGENLMAKWRKSKPPLVSNDYGHLLDPGAKKVGNVISKLILKKYKIWVKTQKKTKTYKGRPNSHHM